MRAVNSSATDQEVQRRHRSFASPSAVASGVRPMTALTSAIGTLLSLSAARMEHRRAIEEDAMVGLGWQELILLFALFILTVLGLLLII